jgi:hypothetical protein
MPENANAEQKTRLLESRFKENTDTMEQLRDERALLVAEHKELQKKFSQISEARIPFCQGEYVSDLVNSKHNVFVNNKRLPNKRMTIVGNS